MTPKPLHLAAAALAACMAWPVLAQPHPPAPHPGRPPAHVVGPLHLDDRYHHDHYYPGVGFVVNTLPYGSVGVGWANRQWFFHGGVWFRPEGPRFVVAVPPPGIVVPFLPSPVVTLWVGGVPYFYANGVYYAGVPEGYRVVTPPPGVETAQAVAFPPTFVIYPRQGQNGAQTDSDRAACNQWAGTQPGATSDASMFQRAFEACMDGRGYSVR